MEKKPKSVNFEGQCLYLKETLFNCQERGLTVVYTQNNDYSVWVFNINLPEKTFFLNNQKTALLSLADLPSVIDYFGEVQVDEDTVCLITERLERENLALKVPETSMIDYDIITLGIAGAQVLRHLHAEGRVANCIHPEYIFLDKEGGFKFANFTICLSPRQEEVKQTQFIEKFFTSKNLSEERFSFNDGTELGNDIKNLGLLLYRLCFGDLEIKFRDEDPSRIAFPLKPKHSYSIFTTIENCLNSANLEKNALSKLLEEFQNEKRLDLHENSGSNDSTMMANINLQNLEKTPNSDSLKPSFIASLSALVSRATTDTEGWFKSYVIENNAAPDEDFVLKILQKTWKKREKIKKLYDIIDKFLDDSDTMKSSAVIVKVLLFLNSIMTKGPIEVLTTSLTLGGKKAQINMSLVVESCSYLNYLLRRIKADWEPIAKSGLKHKSDKLRSQALSYLIYFYAIVLTEKSKFGFDYEKIFAGNFSVEPLLKSQDVKLLFNHKTFVDLHSYCSMLLRFFKLLPEDVGVRAIQFAIAKAVTFEIYNLLGVFCHFVAMFKKVAFTFDRIDKHAVEKLIESMETALDNCVFRFHYCLEELKVSSAFKIFSDLLPHSGLTAISEIKLLQPEPGPLNNFAIEEYFPSNSAIGNFLLATSYGNDDSPSRIMNEDEKLQTIRRELIKASKTSVSRSTVEQMVNSTPFNLSNRAQSDKSGQISIHRQHQINGSQKVIKEEDFSEEHAEIELNPTQNQSPERAKLQLKKLPEKVPLISITRQGAVKNPYLNAHDEEIDLGLDMAEIRNAENPDEIQSARILPPEPKDPDANDEEAQENKEYKVFEDSSDSEKKLSDKGSRGSKGPSQKAYDASKALSNEFLKLVPLPTPKEHKQIQCDLDREDNSPDSKETFNLERFMRDEIANGKPSLKRHSGLDHKIQRSEVW
jgi:hypothetical protein